MVIGLFSSAAAAPAQGPDDEEAQATDRAFQLPQLLQPQAQIRPKAREACGVLSERRGVYNFDSERASRAGEAGSPDTLLLYDLN